MTIDLILGADALQQPLTGIGRYSYELARQLRQRSDIARLRYFSMGRWVPDPIDGLGAQVHDMPPSFWARARSRLSGSRTAVHVYQTLVPRLASWQLRGEANAIFHSPSYVVPSFPGRTVSTVHDLSHMLFPEFHPQARVDFMRLAFEASLKRSTHVITDTETVRQEFIQQFDWPSECVTAIGLGTDSVYHPRADDVLVPALASYGLLPRQYTLCVGTIEPRKNTARLFHAYEQLDPALRRVYPLVLAGGRGWKSDEVHRQMERAARQGWLHYLSYVDQADLPALYAGAALFAYPSLYEGFGLPIVEAMASGTPVITSNTSCMPEVAGGAAKLVNPLDIEEISQALLDGLTDEAWQLEARTKGLARAAEFSWEKCANETVEVYKSL